MAGQAGSGGGAAASGAAASGAAASGGESTLGYKLLAAALLIFTGVVTAWMLFGSGRQLVNKKKPETKSAVEEAAPARVAVHGLKVGAFENVQRAEAARALNVMPMGAKAQMVTAQAGAAGAAGVVLHDDAETRDEDIPDEVWRAKTARELKAKAKGKAARVVAADAPIVSSSVRETLRQAGSESAGGERGKGFAAKRATGSRDEKTAKRHVERVLAAKRAAN